ncbi:MAG: 3-methyladenine DNA glycosylase [Anaerolineaceae bacterium]|nr:3-methyladenine DNA glycosylase [Anaerolineaceae bacterium]
MEPNHILPVSFYNRPVLEVAPDLLGKKLVRLVNKKRISGWICETEAYDGDQDLACHARSGKTQRNAVMFGPPGRAYVYFTYGMHWCLNAVTGPEGYAAAVLLRAVFPIEGKSLIAELREGIAEKNWTNGPAKLTRSFAVNKDQNGANLTHSEDFLWIENGLRFPNNMIHTGPRIGIQNTPLPWRTIPWRFWITEDQLTERLQYKPG